MKPLLSGHLRDLLARLSSLAQIGELARRLVSAQKSFVKVAQCLLTIKFQRLRLWTKDNFSRLTNKSGQIVLDTLCPFLCSNEIISKHAKSVVF